MSGHGDAVQLHRFASLSSDFSELLFALVADVYSVSFLPIRNTGMWLASMTEASFVFTDILLPQISSHGMEINAANSAVVHKTISDKCGHS